MKTTLNRFLFTKATFDSGSLGVLASVVHHAVQPGLYEAVVRRDERVVGTVSWKVSDSSPNTQVDIDLSAVASRARRQDGCGCAEEKNSMLAVRTSGYVQFYASAGVGGYSVVAGQAGEKAERVFDSERLNEGDLFALSLLEPARYSMANRLGSAQGYITVEFSAERARELAAQPAQYVEVWGDRFEPDEVSLASGQGLVFRPHDAARIVVQREGPGRFEERGGRGSVRIQRL